MHTVCELYAFRRDAEMAGMAPDEVESIIDFLSLNPEAGDEIKGTGGCRKLRVAGKGKGKSGGYRVITFFTGPGLPIFLVTVFSKGERASLSRGECNTLRGLTKAIAAEYANKVSSVRSRS